MADPVTMLAIGVVGAATSAFGSYMGMTASARNAAYQSQVAANNAKVAQTNAAMTTEAGIIKAQNNEMKTRSMVGKTLAEQGASGVNVNVGSSPRVRAAEAEIGMLDSLTIRSDAAKQAWAEEVQATGFKAESGLLSTQADQGYTMAPVAAMGTLLSGASTVGGNYLRTPGVMTG